MTAQETELVDRPASRSTVSAGKAYQRRTRRQQAVQGGRLTSTGSPIASALSRVPFVAMIIALLAGGIVGVLWLNTMSDAAGLQATESRLNQMALTAAIQSASRNIAANQDPALLAAQAQSLGMVPPADAAILVVGKDGKGTVIGTPTPVHNAAPALAVAGPATTAAPATSPALATTAAPATTRAPATTGAPGTTAAPVTTAAPSTTAAVHKSSPAQIASAGGTGAVVKKAATAPGHRVETACGQTACDQADGSEADDRQTTQQTTARTSPATAGAVTTAPTKPGTTQPAATQAAPRTTGAGQ